MNLAALSTPAALVDVARMNRNIARMQQRLDALGVRFRPHVKTTKCEQIVRAQIPRLDRILPVVVDRHRRECGPPPDRGFPDSGKDFQGR